MPNVWNDYFHRLFKYLVSFVLQTDFRFGNLLADYYSHDIHVRSRIDRNSRPVQKIIFQ